MNEHETPPDSGEHFENPVEEEEEFTYREMDPDKFANRPENFTEYVQEHPELLPDYRPFAEQVIDRIRNHPEELLTLIGSPGIGKSFLLTPALLEAGDRQGFQPLGSLSRNPQDDESTILDMYASKDIVDALADSRKFMMRPASSRRISGPDKLRQVLHQRFTEGRDGRPGLMVLDDFVGSHEDFPWLVEFIGELAKEHNVRLVTTQVDHPGGREMKTDRLNELGQQVNQSIDLIEIPEQPVPLEAIADLLEAYGVEENAIEGFKSNPKLRRLAVVEIITKRLLTHRLRVAPDDNTIVDREYLLYPLKGHNLFTNSDPYVKRLMLDDAELEVMNRDLIGETEEKTD